MPLTTHVVLGQRAERILLLLHGFGADERDLAGLLPHLDPEGRFAAILPRGQYSGPAGYAWFQIGSPLSVVAGQIRTSLDSIEEVFDKACDDYAMSREQAVVGGFSQGGCLAMALAYGRDRGQRPAGTLVMSGFLPPDPGYDYDWSADPPPALIQHGTSDELVPVQAAEQAAQVLSGNGVPVTYRTYAMEHQVSLESVQDAKAWLDAVRAGERPSGPVPEGETPPPPPEEADDALVRNVGSVGFDREVLQSQVPVIVDFWAPWCQPCRVVSPIVEQIAAMRQGSYKVVKVNIDEAPDIAQRYQVQSIPMIGLFRNGRLERVSMGAKPRPQIEAELGMLVIP
ncbi:MAG TPA: thioredoxin [Actinomycetota bacterium]|nr:thioredoxin [Actinomycetota bacterium]